MSESDFFKKRYATYNDQKLIDILTTDNYKYEMNAFEAAEEVLKERGFDCENLIAVFNNEAMEARKIELEKVKEKEKKTSFASIDEEIVHRISNGESPEMVVLDMKNRDIEGIRAGDEVTSEYLGFSEKENNSWRTFAIVVACILIVLELISIAV